VAKCEAAITYIQVLFRYGGHVHNHSYEFSSTEQEVLCQLKSCQLLHICRNKLYIKSRTNRSNGVTGLGSANL